MPRRNDTSFRTSLNKNAEVIRTTINLDSIAKVFSFSTTFMQN